MWLPLQFAQVGEASEELVHSLVLWGAFNPVRCSLWKNVYVPGTGSIVWMVYGIRTFPSKP